MREQAKKMNVASLKQNAESEESTEIKIAKVINYKQELRKATIAFKRKYRWKLILRCPGCHDEHFTVGLLMDAICCRMFDRSTWQSGWSHSHDCKYPCSRRQVILCLQPNHLFPVSSTISKGNCLGFAPNFIRSCFHHLFSERIS